MAHDSLRGVTVLYSGGTVAIDDMWLFDGTSWTRQFPAVRPVLRSNHAMVYDTVRDRIVLFGGMGFGVPFGRVQDTWEWDGSQWLRRIPLHAPPARSGHGMVYDLARQRTVLFGGEGDTVMLTDTWEWNGEDWSQAAPAHAPPTHSGFAMAFDAARQRTVLFGGWYLGGIDETWEWDGVDWLQRTPAVAPPPRIGGAMAYDAARGGVVLFGGTGRDNVVLGDTWSWNGVSWQQIATAHMPARSSHVMVHEAGRNRTIVFGGAVTFMHMYAFDDTWALADLASPPTFTPFGIACPGSAGLPILGATSSLPFLGVTFEMDLQQLPATSIGCVIVGLSDTSCWLLPLPAELSSFLMPGCWLYTDLVESMWFQAVGGKARCPMTIPAVPAFEGLRFFAQGLIHDPPANARGFVTTNAAAAVLGSWR
jgi:hypothetical protein